MESSDDAKHNTSAPASASEPGPQHVTLHTQDLPPSSTYSKLAGKKRPAAAAAATASGRLSKWAARLFDPDRPKGLIEIPTTIPLNDEFLQNFGRREQAHDAATMTMRVNGEGASMNGNNDASDVRIIDDNDDVEADTDLALLHSATTSSSTEPLATRKVKITNLKFTTTAATLHATCSLYGALEDVKLIMDKSEPMLNAGRAYVVFIEAAAAQACTESFKELEGRPLNVSLAADNTGGSGTAANNQGKNNMAGPWRYYEHDISTKCYRCGQVGHIEANCDNAPVPKPCPICAALDHDMRTCPNKVTCFHCGVVGHVSRHCTLRDQRLPMPRQLCGICFQAGHDKLQCNSIRAQTNLSRDAICLQCGERGHYLCTELKWFTEFHRILDTSVLSCSNCGRVGHLGADCNRPNLDRCAKDDQLARLEVERAWLALEEAGSGGAVVVSMRGRPTERGQHDDYRRHTQSLPPPQRHDDASHRRNNNTPPPPPHRSPHQHSHGDSGRDHASTPHSYAHRRDSSARDSSREHRRRRHDSNSRGASYGSRDQRGDHHRRR